MLLAALVLAQSGNVVPIEDRSLFDSRKGPPIELDDPGNAFHVADWLAGDREVHADDHGMVRADARSAEATVRSDTDRVLLAQLSGARLLFVDGDPFPGDPLGRGYEVPIALRAGESRLRVDGIEGAFELRLRAVCRRIVIGTADVGYPRISRHTSTWRFQDLTLTFLNASTEPVGSMHVHYGVAVAESGLLRMTDWMCGGHRMAPLGVYRFGVYVSPAQDRARGVSSFAYMPVLAFSEGDACASAGVFRIDCEGDAPYGRTPWTAGPSEPTRPGILGRVVGGEMFVYGTLGRDEEDRDALATARYEQQRFWIETGVVPRLWSDMQYGAEPRTRSVVVFGNEETNALWLRALPEDASVRIRRGEVRVGDRVFAGDDLLVVYVCEKPRTFDAAVFVGATGTRGMRSLILSDVLLDDSLKGDYAMFRADEDGAPVLVLSGGSR